MAQETKNLFETSSFLNSVINCADYVIIATDYSGIIRQFNSKAERLLNFQKAEVTGKVSIEKFFLDGELLTYKLELERELLTELNNNFSVLTKKTEMGISEEKIWNLQSKEKDIIPLKISITILKDEDQNFIGFLFIAKDVREELDAQKELNKLRKFHEIVIDNADIWINTLDRKGNVSIWNRAAERISGYSRKEIIGNPEVWELLYPIKKYRDEVFSKALSILNENQIVTGFETKIKRKDGEYRIISWNSRILVDDNGNHYGSIAIGNDITRLKRAEFDQDEFKKKLEEKNKDLENVVYVTSHDLRSPLVNIQGFIKEIETSLDEIKEIIFYFLL